jgi:hypothetical protein
MFHQELFFDHGTNHQVDEENKTLYLDHKMSRNLGIISSESTWKH